MARPDEEYPRTGGVGAYRYSLHDHIDSRGHAAGHEFPVFVKSIRRREEVQMRRCE
jgi:hypothetical protein